MIRNKTCRKCKKVKDLTEFYKSRREKDGVQSYCKQCTKQWLQDNKEKIAEYKKQYREDNKEKIAEYKKQYHEDNKEKIAERKKQYYQDNKEKIAERAKQYREDNPEYKKQYMKERRKNDEQLRIRQCLSSNLRQCLKRVSKAKKSSILKYIGCSMKDLQNHLNSTKQPEWGDDVHIDHIIPCSLFDHTNEEEIKKCWHWRNLRYLPSIDNISKNNTLDLDLIRSYNIEDLLPEGTDV